MKYITIGIGILMCLIGTFLLLNDNIIVPSVIMIIAGISSIVSDFVFPPNEPADERSFHINSRSGHTAYLLSLVSIFFTILLYQYNVIDEPLYALLIILVIHVLSFPIALLVHNKIN